MHRQAIAALLLFILALLPAMAAAAPWPDEAVTEFNQAAEALSAADTPADRASAIAAMRDVARAHPDADGSALVAELLDKTQAAELSHARTLDALAALAGTGAVDADTLAAIAGPVLEGAAALAESGSLVPSAAIALDDAIDRFDQAAARAGLPGLDQLVSDLLDSGDVAPGLRERLSAFSDLVETYRGLQDLVQADEASTRETLDRLLGYAGAANPIFAGPAAVPFRDLLVWNNSMARESTAAIDLVTDAIETGEFDNEAYQRIADRINDLARGPWTSDTARDFLTKVCEGIPLLEAWCGDLFELAEDLFVGCAQIDCDCDNVGGGLMSGPNRVTCELTQAGLISACEAAGEITGTCDADASGPAAFP